MRTILGVALTLIACAGSDTRRVDTNRSRAGSPRDSGFSPAVRKTLDSLQQLVRQDTSSPAYKALNLMTAPVSVIPLRAFESDTLQWAARSDSCAMVVRSFGPTGQKMGFGGDWFSVEEARGTMGPGGAIDISPSPDWKHIAYTTSMRLPDDTTRWKAALDGGPLSVEIVRRAAESRADGSTWVTYAVVEPPADECSGEGCPTPLVSPLLGNWPIRWTADGRYLLLGTQGDSSHWSAVDPVTRQRVDGVAATPHQLDWETRSVMTAMKSTVTTGITGGGPYRFTNRGDSILVRGPDRNGRIAERVVGAGVPVAVTRNGEYLLAVRREDARIRSVIYEFSLFHAMMRSSCDQPH